MLSAEYRINQCTPSLCRAFIKNKRVRLNTPIINKVGTIKWLQFSTANTKMTTILKPLTSLSQRKQIIMATADTNLLNPLTNVYTTFA
jgi:hypothetical protein